ncbi:MAG TPA: hypothetical protein VJY39_02600 [Acidisphaera sp.]|nr:hypothetical protein [Acidisphaera sp.]
MCCNGRVGRPSEAGAASRADAVRRLSVHPKTADCVSLHRPACWNAFCTANTAIDGFTPATHIALRGNGEKAWFGWSSSPRIEELRDAWFDAPDLAAQQKIAAEIQAQAFVDVPYIPLGMFYNPSVYRRDVTDIVHGFPIFWNMRRA